MAIKGLVTDPATEKQANVVDVNGYQGLVVGTHPLKEYETKSLFFADATGNTDMNINRGAVTGSAMVYVDNAEWPWTVVAGNANKWDFDSIEQNHSTTGTKSIKSDAAANSVAEAGSYFNTTDQTSIEGWAYVTKWKNNEDFEIYGWESGTPGIVGNAVAMNDYMDVGDQNVWQKWKIPLSDMGLGGQQLNAIRLLNTHRDNNLYLDDIQFNASGANAAPNEYSIQPPVNKDYFIDKIRFTVADDVDNTLADSNMPNVDYKTWLGAGSLINGIGYQRIQTGEPSATATFKGVGELLVQPYSEMTNAMSTGTSVYYNASFSFPQPIRLKGKELDKLKIIIQDDLSNLTELKVTAIGWEEKETHKNE